MDWQPIETAPKDRTFVLVHFTPPEESFGHRYAGRSFVAFHEGKTESDYDLGWGLFPGYGGVPDAWLAGWMPLPTPPQEQP